MCCICLRVLCKAVCQQSQHPIALSFVVVFQCTRVYCWPLVYVYVTRNHIPAISSHSLSSVLPKAAVAGTTASTAVAAGQPHCVCAYGVTHMSCVMLSTVHVLQCMLDHDSCLDDNCVLNQTLQVPRVWSHHVGLYYLKCSNISNSPGSSSRMWLSRSRRLITTLVLPVSVSVTPSGRQNVEGRMQDSLTVVKVFWCTIAISMTLCARHSNATHSCFDMTQHASLQLTQAVHCSMKPCIRTAVSSNARSPSATVFTPCRSRPASTQAAKQKIVKWLLVQPLSSATACARRACGCTLLQRC